MDNSKGHTEIWQVARDLREKHGLTQAKLATLAGVSLPALQRFEAGNKSAQLDTVTKIISVLGCELVIQLKKAPTLRAVDER